MVIRSIGSSALGARKNLVALPQLINPLLIHRSLDRSCRRASRADLLHVLLNAAVCAFAGVLNEAKLKCLTANYEWGVGAKLIGQKKFN